MTDKKTAENTEQARLSQIKDLLFGDENRKTHQLLDQLEVNFNQKTAQLNQQLLELETKQQSQKQENDLMLSQLSKQLGESTAIIEQQKVNQLALANLLEQLAIQLRQS